jgi:hypothetical protein
VELTFSSRDAFVCVDVCRPSLSLIVDIISFRKALCMSGYTVAEVPM